MNEQVSKPDAVTARPNSLSPGELLRAARERAGWTPETLAAELCLPIGRLHALEQDDLAGFGGAVYVRGYLRRAAALLGSSPQELISAFEACFENARPAEIIPGPAPGQTPRRGLPGWAGPVAGAAAVMVAVASTWWLIGAPDQGGRKPGASAGPGTAKLEFTSPEAPQRAQATPIPEAVESGAPMRASDALAEAAPAAGEDIPPEAVAEAVTTEALNVPVRVVDVPAPAAPPPGTVELRLEFSEDCWLEVIDAEDRRLAYRLHQAGDVARLRGTAPMSLFLGNARGVQLTVDGMAVPLRPARRDGTARLTVGGGAG